MKVTPIVTVIIPAYNASAYLKQTLESVLQQSYKEFEILVIDDGSTDDTKEIVQHYSQQDNRIRLISQNNQGVSVARNLGIQNATGDFIAFLDADDLWLPNKLAAHVDHFNIDQSLGMSFARVEFVDDNGQSTGQHSNLRLIRVKPQHLYQENLACTPSNVVVRRDVLKQIGGFDKELSGFADIELFLRISCYPWKVEGLDQILVRYRISSAGMSSQLNKMEEEWNRFSSKVKYYAPELVDQHYHQAKAVLLRYLARRALRLRLAPEIGIRFINRALYSDWTLILREPRRTLLTTIAVYSQYLPVFN